MAAQQFTNLGLEKFKFKRLSNGIRLYNPSIEELSSMVKECDFELDKNVNKDRILDVLKHNLQSIYVVRHSNTNKYNKCTTGLLAQIPLNRDGHRALFTGDLNTVSPELKYICGPYEIPSAIYIWCIYITPELLNGINLVIARLSAPKVKNAPVYSLAETSAEERALRSIGFHFNATQFGITVSDLMEYQRSDELNEHDKNTPKYDSSGDSYRSGTHKIGINVVHNIEELMQVTAIRAATYMAEHNSPYDRQFDGNDFSCTHLLGHVDGNPAGCLRIRFFSSFAKIERLAVIRSARKTRLSSELIKAGIELCRKKGYRNIYGHSEEKIVPLWKRHGFKPRTEESTFSISGDRLIEGDLEVSADNDMITMHTDPLVINRPEGQWHYEGILEQEMQ